MMNIVKTGGVIMKHVRKWMTVCLMIVLVFSLGFSSVSAANVTKSGDSNKAAGCVDVTIYEHANYEGEWRHYGCVDSEGFYSLGWWDNEVSSIIVSDFNSAGTNCIRVFEDQHYGGKSTVFCGDVPYVGDAWNDDIESMRME
jgi:hypothetical protein